MKIKEAKKLVGSQLDKVGITIVYYIDDYLSFDGLSAIMKYIEDTSEDELAKHKEVVPEEIVETKDFDPEIREKVQAWWQLLSNTERKNVIKVCVPTALPHSESKIQTLFGKRCKLCSPEEWTNEFSLQCLDRIKNGEKILLLFDEKLGEEETAEGEGRTGSALAQSFYGRDGVKENTYCGIFSQSFEVEEEFQFRNNHLKQLSSWAFPFSKKRLPDNDEYTLFIEGLNNLFWVGYVDELLEVAKTLIVDTSNRMSEELGKIYPPEFKQVVIDSSMKEGSRETDTLLRLIHIIFNRELYRTLADDQEKINKINSNVDYIKEIDAVSAKLLKKELENPRYDTIVVSKLFQDENFIPADVVNRLLLPLQNGDVFCVNDKDYYVLLCQPCNISIRNGGKRSTDISFRW